MAATAASAAALAATAAAVAAGVSGVSAAEALANINQGVHIRSQLELEVHEDGTGGGHWPAHGHGAHTATEHGGGLPLHTIFDDTLNVQWHSWSYGSDVNFAADGNAAAATSADGSGHSHVLRRRLSRLPRREAAEMAWGASGGEGTRWHSEGGDEPACSRHIAASLERYGALKLHHKDGPVKLAQPHPTGDYGVVFASMPDLVVTFAVRVSPAGGAGIADVFFAAGSSAEGGFDRIAAARQPLGRFASGAATDADGWSRAAVPLALFTSAAADNGTAFDELWWLAGGSQTRVEIELDDIVIEAAPGTAAIGAAVAAMHPALRDEPPPPPGARDDEASWCQYLATPAVPEDGPLCRVVDGDHAVGEWVRNCDRAGVGERPDYYAYGRAIGQAPGQYDYRVCFRMSAEEMLRTREALAWTWRPASGCRLAPVDADAFDAWLGTRTVLFLGDSITSQHYFSLALLIADAVVEQTDCPGECTQVDTCAESSVGSEGGGFGRLRLKSGGQILRVLQHNQIFDQLKSLNGGGVWWRDAVAGADVVVFNVGHHYHTVDEGFEGYASMAAAASAQLGAAMKPGAHLIFRTTNLGHWGCDSQFVPLASAAEAEAALKHPGADKYSWLKPLQAEAQHWPAAFAASPLAGRAAFLNISFADARADGHVASAMHWSPSASKRAFGFGPTSGLDCLHMCYPGPADVWSVALYNMLLNNEEYRA